MSIHVENVTKKYEEQEALSNVSFSINKGEIVGFLGPNGAGKSTMMKIITCYLPQTSGKVSVCGFDVEAEPMKVREKLGYLPEHNPQYVEMYIKEYLRFAGGVHKVNNLDARIEELIELVGLQKEQHKKIGMLSKGYRQRVGLAQALIHDPEVLILDEPTTGLDPNQIIEIRELIKSVGKEKTVMMSTHIMQEVEAICDRVIIINEGKSVADKSTKEIRQDQSQKTVRVLFESAPDMHLVKNINGVTKCTREEDGALLVHGSGNKDLRKVLFEFAIHQKLVILEMHEQTQDLEGVFRQLTAKRA